MNIKERFEQLRWEWLQSLGRTRYLWRCAFAGAAFGAYFYPFKKGLDLAFGWQSTDAQYPSLAHFIISCLSGCFVWYLFGIWQWGRYQRKYQAASSPITAAYLL